MPQMRLLHNYATGKFDAAPLSFINANMASCDYMIFHARGLRHNLSHVFINYGEQNEEKIDFLILKQCCY